MIHEIWLIRYSNIAVKNIFTECLTRLDIVFILDKSGSINEQEFEDMKDFVKDVIDLFNVESDGVRIGVLTYSNTPSPIFYLDDSFSKAMIKTMVMNISNNTNGYTYTGKFITFLTPKNDRYHLFVKMLDFQFIY